ncbi:MAG: fructose 1,6-bisphosphatase [Candidatus Omnitrophica bacterium]|nr:fructose 1,6-bisphosphatase [Candidatus Omnitrophota bacterium]
MDLSNAANSIEPFASTDERDQFISGGQLTWIAGKYTPAELIDAQSDTKRYLERAGSEDRIFVADNLPVQVKRYSTTRTSAVRKLPALQQAEQEALVARLQAAFDFHRNAISSIRMQDLSIGYWYNESEESFREDFNKARQAFILDEENNPSFFFKGEVDGSKFLAVTASSGGYKYAGYDFEQLGQIPPRSIYSNLAMVESYMEMAKTDPEAIRAYRLKLLHEFMEVRGERMAWSHRTEDRADADLINKYDAKALEMWKAREAEKARVKLQEVENKKTIAEATSANIGRFLKGRLTTPEIAPELIDAANAELKKLVEAGLLVRYRVEVDDGRMVIFSARQNSKAVEDNAKIPAAILNVFLSVLDKAKALQLFTGEDISNKSFSQQAAALQIAAPLPALAYVEPEGWAQSVFGNVNTALAEPVGQPKGFFTTDYQGYTLTGLLAAPLEQIPDEVVQAVRNKLSQYISEGKILGADVRDGGATDIDILVTHRYGELNSAVQKLILEAMREGLLKAQQSGLLKGGVNIASMSISDLGKALRVKYQTHSIVERKSEPVVIAKIIGAGIGASNVKLYHEFFMPGSTPLKKLGFVPMGKVGVRGFRAIVRRVDDVLKGNLNGDVWEFETSSAFEDKDGKKYSSVDQSLELLALASQPNDFVITAIYTVEGSTVPSTEPIISVVYQPVYAEDGNLRTLNPTFICRSQSGADAVGGVASMFYDVNFVPGGPNGERYVVTRPATLEEARKAPKEGTAHVVIYGWQSKGNGIIPAEAGTVIDHVAINPPALNPERDLADFLASVMTTHQFDQPYLAPFAAQEQVDPLREAQSHLFMRAPKEADVDPVMDEVEAKVASGEFLSVDDDKADMGGIFGHNFTPAYMLAIDMATVIEAVEQGTLTDGNIIGLIEKRRLSGLTPDIGDDSHVLMLGDKSRNSAQSHQLSFLAFVRGYLGAVVAGEKPYGLAQDFAGREAKAAMKNPYFYSKFNERFFEILRTVMPADYMSMVDKMEAGWKKWQATGQSETVLTKGFSGNVSNQGIGSARYLVDVAGKERQFGILAGDKMGPAALNRPIREAVYAALAAGEFENGLVFEIWDAKAYDHLGNIPISELPTAFSDVEESINELKDSAEQEVVRAAYPNGQLSANLDADSKKTLAGLLKKAGYVPSKRIFLDAQKDKEAIYLYLADSDRFNIKQVWSKKQAGWNLENPAAYLLKPVLGSSVTKLGILAGGEYIGKDDPVMVGNLQLMKHVYEFLKTNPLIIQGDMNGSHWLAAIPTAAKYAVANKESHPIMVGLVYTLSEDGTKMASVEDIFGQDEYDAIRNKMFKFDFEFKKAQLGGQFEPYGTNWRTVEASYPLAKLLRALQAANSPFLVKNKPASTRALRPVGITGAVRDLFNAVAGNFAMPSAPADWRGETDTQQKLYKSSLALQSSGVSHKLSEAVLGVAKDAANKKVVLISSSVLRSDPTLILALQSINEQINQSLGIFGSSANVEANAYQFVLVADDAQLTTAKDVDAFFAAIAKATNNGVVVNKDIFSDIITQGDMFEGQIANPNDLLKQLNRMGIADESIAALVGSSAWTQNLKVGENAVVVNVDTQDNKAAFASNALFGAVETLATADKKLPEPLVEKLDIALLPSGAMEVKQEEVNKQVSDEFTTYRVTVKAI